MTDTVDSRPAPFLSTRFSFLIFLHLWPVLWSQEALSNNCLSVCVSVHAVCHQPLVLLPIRLHMLATVSFQARVKVSCIASVAGDSAVIIFLRRGDR